MQTPTVAPPEPERLTYHRLTRTATYGFLSVLPLLALYEALIVLVNRGSAYEVHVGAEVWIKRLLLNLGVTGMASVGLVVLVAGGFVFLYERKKKLPIRPSYFGWMVAESAVYAVVAAVAVSRVVGLIFSMAPVRIGLAAAGPSQAAPPDLWTMLTLSVGAGLYEELVFRVLLVGGLYWGLRRVFARRGAAYLTAAVAGAAVFSAVHYLGALGDVFTLPSFTFRFLFGLLMNALFLARGFGVAAWTHALYDVMVVTHLLG
ncbi:CPBP family intramembrane glutamic endopeptidase [Rhodocaloribacter sp.]